MERLVLIHWGGTFGDDTLGGTPGYNTLGWNTW